jgi:2-dehydropantoate 2-reductase
MMKIFIIGAGAIGKTLAVALKLNGKDVVLVRGSVDDGSRSVEKIEVVRNDGGKLEAEIEVGTLSRFSALDGIIVLTNKSFGNDHLARTLEAKATTSPLVILQNGLGVERPFTDRDFPEVYRCVLFVTSQTISANRIAFKPVTISPIGIIKGSKANLQLVVGELNSPVFQFKAETDIQTAIWTKAIINSVFNSICPLLEIDNGVFQREAQALDIAKRVIAECAAIAKENGIDLEANEIVERLLLISKSADGQLISTLQDINNHRPTEIETLNFEIVNIARVLNKENEVADTRLLGELTRLKSELSRANYGLYKSMKG